MQFYTTSRICQHWKNVASYSQMVEMQISKEISDNKGSFSFKFSFFDVTAYCTSKFILIQSCGYYLLLLFKVGGVLAFTQAIFKVVVPGTATI